MQVLMIPQAPVGRAAGAVMRKTCRGAPAIMSEHIPMRVKLPTVLPEMEPEDVGGHTEVHTSVVLGATEGNGAPEGDTLCEAPTLQADV